LIIAILVMLVLSALGMVALRSANESNWLSGTYRVQSQSNSYSDAVVQYGLMRSGQRADSLDQLLTNRSDIDLLGGGTTSNVRRGGYQIFSPKADPADGVVTLHPDLGDGGLIATPELEVEYSYIVRDPMPGPPAPGYDDRYCFLGVSIGSEAIMGRGSEAEEMQRRRLRSMGRHVSDSFIGPVECGGTR
jgi:hypothetical protein